MLATMLELLKLIFKEQALTSALELIGRIQLGEGLKYR